MVHVVDAWQLLAARLCLREVRPPSSSKHDHAKMIRYAPGIMPLLLEETESFLYSNRS
jgi:hypothetical protein